MRQSLVCLLLIFWFEPVNATDCAIGIASPGPGQLIKTSPLRSPNNRTTAWTEGQNQVSPRVFHTKLIVTDLATSRQEVIFRSELTADGQLHDYNPREVLGTYDGYCAVDWSADSRYLLILHMRGPQGSDHLGIESWVFERLNGAKHKLDTRQLLKEIQRYNIEKKFGAKLYYLIPTGWESASGSRVVLKGLPSAGEGTDFGTWSIETNGTKPKLIEPESDKYQPLRFGKFEKTTP